MTGSSRVRPSASQIAMSTAALAVGLPTVRASRALTTSRSVSVSPTSCGCEELFDHRDDAGLGLAVGERPRRRLGHADHAVVGMHPDQHVLGGVDLAGGELQRLDVRDGERNRLDGSDFHSSSSIAVAAGQRKPTTGR